MKRTKKELEQYHKTVKAKAAAERKFKPEIQVFRHASIEPTFQFKHIGKYDKVRFIHRKNGRIDITMTAEGIHINTEGSVIIVPNVSNDIDVRVPKRKHSASKLS